MNIGKLKRGAVSCLRAVSNITLSVVGGVASLVIAAVVLFGIGVAFAFGVGISAYGYQIGSDLLLFLLS